MSSLCLKDSLGAAPYLEACLFQHILQVEVLHRMRETRDVYHAAGSLLLPLCRAVGTSAGCFVHVYISWAVIWEVPVVSAVVWGQNLTWPGAAPKYRMKASASAVADIRTTLRRGLVPVLRRSLSSSSSKSESAERS